MIAAVTIDPARSGAGSRTLISAPFPGFSATAAGLGRTLGDGRESRTTRRLAPIEVTELAPGARLHGTPYRVVRLLGQGGMGEVYEVEHSELGTRGALKVLHRSHIGRPDLAARMRDEARALGHLRHPNLVEVFDLGEADDGRPWFAMPLLHGRDLKRELARLGALPASTAARLTAAALDGLSVAHAAGLVHRDVKLENLFLGDDGSLKVLDFGVAKAIAEGSDGRTFPGASPGTPRVMAPEQIVGGPIDARTDVYAAGLALYELCVGRGPFDDLRGNDHALRFAHCERAPLPPSAVAPQPITPELEAVILTAIAKAPADRFQSAAEMAVALRRAIAPASRPEPPPAYVAESPARVVESPARATPPRARHRSAARRIARMGARHAGSAALAVAIFALGIVFGRSLQLSRADASAPHASAGAR